MVLSAFNRLSIDLYRAARNKSIPVQILATNTSTTTINPSIASVAPTDLPIAMKFAPPPIQDPAKAAIPRQISSGS